MILTSERMVVRSFPSKLGSIVARRTLADRSPTFKATMGWALFSAKTCFWESFAVRGLASSFEILSVERPDAVAWFVSFLIQFYLAFSSWEVRAAWQHTFWSHLLNQNFSCTWWTFWTQTWLDPVRGATPWNLRQPAFAPKGKSISVLLLLNSEVISDTIYKNRQEGGSIGYNTSSLPYPFAALMVFLYFLATCFTFNSIAFRIAWSCGDWSRFGCSLVGTPVKCGSRLPNGPNQPTSVTSSPNYPVYQ